MNLAKNSIFLLSIMQNELNFMNEHFNHPPNLFYKEAAWRIFVQAGGPFLDTSNIEEGPIFAKLSFEKEKRKIFSPKTFFSNFEFFKLAF